MPSELDGNKVSTCTVYARGILPNSTPYRTTNIAQLTLRAQLLPQSTHRFHFISLQLNLHSKFLGAPWVAAAAEEARATGSRVGRVRCAWNQTCTATGRLSSSGPNMQVGVVRRVPVCGSSRMCYAREGHKWAHRQADTCRWCVVRRRGRGKRMVGRQGGRRQMAGSVAHGNTGLQCLPPTAIV